MAAELKFKDDVEPGLRPILARHRQRLLDELTELERDCYEPVTPTLAIELKPRPLGAALAMRVMQSDLYQQLDDAERADCDELVRQNIEWFKSDCAAASAPSQGGEK